MLETARATALVRYEPATSAMTQAIIERPGLPGVFTDTSYTLPDDLDITTWLEIGEALQQTEKSIGWWLGDWWRSGTRSFGQMASQAAQDHVLDVTGHTYGTVRNAGLTAAKFQGERRRPTVPFTYHTEVAGLADDVADGLLDEVEQTGMRRDELRERVKQVKARQRQAVIDARPLPGPGARPFDVAILPGDALHLPLRSGIVDLFVTSPPYALEKAYDEAGEVDPLSWLLFMNHFLKEAHRVAKAGGRLALNVPLDTTLGGFRPTYAQAVGAAQRAGWTYRSTIVWHDNQLGKSNARGSIDSAGAPSIIAPVEMVGLFSKGDWGRDGAGSDLTHQDWLTLTNGFWQFPGESSPWEGHPAPFPLELPRRLLHLLSLPGDLVCDPFVGSGTTAEAARRAGRRFIGFDRSRRYVESSIRRVSSGGIRA